MYTPLYVKSNYSFLSSLVRIEKLISDCIEKNIKNIALCDDNMIAIMLFYKICKNNDINPIIGINLKFENNDILFYAKNYEGYKNILKLVTEKDNLSVELIKNYKDNLICILPYKSISIYKNINNLIGNIYIGVSNKDEEFQCKSICNDLVFINKVLYLDKKDSKYYRYLLMMRDKKNVMDEVVFNDDFNYLLTYNEALNLVSKKVLDETNNISKMCNVVFPKTENMIPNFDNKFNLSSSEYLTKLSIQGLTLRLNNNVSEKYKKRLLYELEIINKMKFSDYFLIVYDFVKYAKRKGILVGPGRGSAGGSLVAYSLGIIDVDPIKYDLLFERFLNPGRVTMPDIDIDFPDIYRDEVINYTREKYGIKRVAGIVAVGTLKAKAVLDDVARILKIESSKVDRLKKFIGLNTKLSDLYLKNEEFKNIVDNDDRLKKLYELSLIFEGFPKNTTVHASGIVISKYDLDDIVPLIKQDGVYIASYEGPFLEELGLLKMDFLGNSNLTLIMQILEDIKDKEGKNINFLNIPLDDKNTIKIFYDVFTNGIFQFESDTMKNLLKKIKVHSFLDIVAADALVRPGPDTQTYIERKNSGVTVNYLNDEIKKILEPTYGVLVYQEQIMQIANVMAGFSLQEADTLRRAMSKKKKDLLKVQEEKFIEGSIKKGYDYKTAKSYYDDILSFAEYGFNKSHAVAYSIIAYKMGYLKAHYPKYFYLNLLTTSIGKDDKVSMIVREARLSGIKFLLPDINKSTQKFEIVDNCIMFPISTIKSIGVSTSIEIIKKRGNGFLDLFECLTKLTELGINKKTIEILTFSSAFDNFNYNKRTIIENLDNLLNFAFISKGLPSDMIEHPKVEIFEEYDQAFLMAKEKELFGFYLSYHPTSKYKEVYKVFNLNEVVNHIGKMVDTIALVDKVKVLKDKNGNEMAFITGSDELSTIEYISFSSTFATIKDIDKGNVILVRGKVEKRNNVQIIVEKAKIIG